MSKIGRKPIDCGKLTVTVDTQVVRYNNNSYELPVELKAELVGSDLYIKPNELLTGNMRLRDVNRVWGLHRALLCNYIKGLQKDFKFELKIVGLGYKATVEDKKITFNLGYSHPKYFELPENVSLQTDRSGQLLTITSQDKMAAGLVASEIIQLKKPEPYKGTGIQIVGKEIARKAGKTKSS